MKTRTVNLQAQRCNKNGCTKILMVREDMISFVDQDLTLKPRTDLYVFIFGGRVPDRQTQRTQNSPYISRSMRVRGKTLKTKQNNIISSRHC